MEISVARALKEITKISEQISKASDKPLIMCVKGNKTVHGYSSNDEFCKNTMSTIQSIKDLVKRREKIKSAIVASNAVTNVTVAGKQMTVAEAIERKTSMPFLEKLLFQLREQHIQAQAIAERENNALTQSVERMVTQFLGKDTVQKSRTDEAADLQKSLYAASEAKVLAPSEILKICEELDKEITDFRMDVDVVLSESNALTKINVV